DAARTLFGWFDLFSGLFLFKQIDQRVLIAVFELSRIEVAGFCLDDMSGKIEHLFRSLELGNVLEIRLLVANFVGIAQRSVSPSRPRSRASSAMMCSRRVSTTRPTATMFILAIV